MTNPPPSATADPGPLPTYVQPLETTVDPSASTDLHQPPWQERSRPTRDQIIYSLESSSEPHHRKRASKLTWCCRFPSLRVRPSGDAYFSAGRCRDRLCPTCGASRSREVAERVNHLINKAPQLRFLTLTLRSTTNPLSEQLDLLTSSFRRLRQTATWRAYCNASIATIQITLNPRTNQWHPHLHVLIEGIYMPRDEIVVAWKKATGGSTVVDIRPVHDRATTSTYIARYVSNPNELADWPPPAIREYSDAIHGRRTVITTGSWHNVGLPPKDTDPQEGPSKQLIPLCIIAWGLRNNRWEAKALHTWMTAKTPAAVYFLPDYPAAQAPTPTKKSINELTPNIPMIASSLESIYYSPDRDRQPGS